MYQWDLKDIIHTTLSLWTIDGTSETNFIILKVNQNSISNIKSILLNYPNHCAQKY